MTLRVTHAFQSAMPDDAIALAAGEICPQAHWNQDHQIDGTVRLVDMDTIPAATVLGNASTGATVPATLTPQQLVSIITSDPTALAALVAALGA